MSRFPSAFECPGTRVRSADSCRYRILLLFILVTLLWIRPVAGQTSHNPANVALGGGGTAYTTGYEALFVNPANLHIQERDYQWQFSALTMGSTIQHPTRTENLSTFRKRYLRGTALFWPPTSETVSYDPQALIDRNYASNREISEHRNMGEIHWVGVQTIRDRRSYAMALRTRYGNRYETGRGFYDGTPLEDGSREVLNRSLTHRFQVLHDISFGYAESFSFLDGLLPHLSQIIVGIAPKVVLGGGYLDTEIEDRYVRDESSDTFSRRRSFSQYSAGILTDAAPHPFTQNPVEALQSRPDRRELFRPSGFGLGLDVGITWLMTLGDDFSFDRDRERITRRSLRISLALTDIGLLRYSDRPVNRTIEPIEEDAEGLPAPSATLFEGRPGEHIHFLQNNSPTPLEQSPAEREALHVSLPSTFKAGMMLQLQRLSIMADLTFGLTNDAFQTTAMVSHLGLEFRAAEWLPLRVGTRLAPNLPNIYTAGMGLESKRVSFGVGLQFRSRSPEPTAEIVTASVGSLRIYLP